MKKCPYCAEEIQDDAIKCRFCGESLKKRWWKNCFMGCFIWSLLSIVLIILFIYLSFLFVRIIAYKAFFGPIQRFPPYHHPPFTGQGIEGIFREFSEAFRLLWERLMDFFQMGQQHYNKITF